MHHDIGSRRVHLARDCAAQSSGSAGYQNRFSAHFRVSHGNNKDLILTDYCPGFWKNSRFRWRRGKLSPC
jgi:hypothetical protein